MSLQLFSDSPAWFWLLCIAAGLLFAAGMYYREKKVRQASDNKPIYILLSVLRFVGATLICFLLLNPYLRSAANEMEKPIVIIAQDNSASILEGIADTAAFNNALNALKKELSDDFEVRTYAFDNTITETDTFNYSGKSTDISVALNELQSIYRNLNVAGIVLGSDGIYNVGSNPLYVKNDLNAPYYTIAIGDTVPKKDVRITRVQSNKLVYLGDKFSVISHIQAVFCNGQNITVAMREITGANFRSLGEKSVQANSDKFTTSQTWELNADAPGVRHYQVVVRSIEGEATTDNNVFDFFVEVLDARQKILLLAAAPHPDIAALRASIETNKNYELDVTLATEFSGNINDYTLIILHNLPSAKLPVKQIITEIKNKSIPVWFVAGSEVAIAAFNDAQNLVRIEAGRSTSSEVTAAVNAGFNLFQFDANYNSVLAKLPPLTALYGQYAVSPATQILLFQKVGTVSTQFPLLLYSIPGANKNAILLGEHIWKWRMYDYLFNKNQNTINDLVNKTVQYLAAKDDKKQFRVTVANQVINENEQVIFDGELYNDSYELINEPEAQLSITNSDGKVFDFTMDRSGRRYIMNAGFYPPGNYTFSAKVNSGNKMLTDNGAFVISPVRLETLNTTADHNLLYQLAALSNGKMIYASQLDQLAQSIKESETAKPVLREVVKTQSIINLRWLFFIIFSMLGIEWFIRKYLGTY